MRQWQCGRKQAESDQAERTFAHPLSVAVLTETRNENSGQEVDRSRLAHAESSQPDECESGGMKDENAKSPEIFLSLSGTKICEL